MTELFAKISFIVLGVVFLFCFYSALSMWLNGRKKRSKNNDTKLQFTSTNDGTLFIDFGIDGQKPEIYFEIATSVEDISRKDNINLRVIVAGNNPQ